MKLRQQGILKLYMENEELIAKLYETYAKKFPGHALFWYECVQDENRHARVFRWLMDHASEGAYYFDETRFKAAAISSFNRYIQELIMKADTDSYTAYAAVTTAMDLEEALLEKSVFDQFEGVTASYKHTLKKIKEDCVKHREKFKAFRGSGFLEQTG